MVPAPKHDEKEELYEQIRELHSTKPAEPREEGRYNLDCLELGKLIEKGCNAAVYEARLLSTATDETGSDISVLHEDAESDISLLEDGESDVDTEVDTKIDISPLADDESDISVIEEDDCSEVEEYEIYVVGPEVDVDVETHGNHDDEDSLSFTIIDEDRASLFNNPDQERSFFIFDEEVVSSMIVDEDSLSDVSIIEEDSESDDDDICYGVFKSRGDNSMSDLNINLIPIEPGGTNIEKGTRETTLNEFDLAVKMMFNYDAESNAEAIMRAMKKEVVPLTSASDHLQIDQWRNGNHVKKKAWPTHPNIVQMYGVFVGAVPDVPDNVKHYPAALPPRIFSEGLGRNMTLFLVMKRYTCTLSQYLTRESPSMNTRCFLLTQLLEGVTFLQQQGVAHRDLKSDNLLIDMDGGDAEWPRLVISDFGCCLNEGTLQIPYVTDEINKGGNPALMAPEIACAKVGRRSVLDYRKVDQWAAGALVYEIMGCPNPFYRSNTYPGCLDSRTYGEEDLPCLPDEVPEVVKKLAKNLLCRDTSKRLSAAVAATVMQLYMKSLSDNNINNNNNEEMKSIQNWAVNNAVHTILARLHGHSDSNVPSDITQAFLSRISHTNVARALHFMETL